MNEMIWMNKTQIDHLEGFIARECKGKFNAWLTGYPARESVIAAKAQLKGLYAARAELRKAI